MKVIQISSGSSPHSGEGPTIATDRLSAALASLGHSVSVLYTRGAVREPRPYTVEEFDAFVGGVSVDGSVVRYICFALGSARKLHRLLRTEKHDIIHFHTTLAACFGLNVAKRYQVPVVYTYHSPLLIPVDEAREQPDGRGLRLQSFRNPIDVSSRILESYVMRHVEKVVALTAMMKKKIVDYFDLAPSVIEVVPNGTDTDLYRREVPCSELRRKLGMGDETSVIMCVASIERRKNQLTLVKAIAGIAAVIPDIRVILVGRTYDASYLAEIQDYVRENHLQDKVIFTGHISPGLLPQYYNLCDVFVLPSLAENLPHVLLEAMSCHTAIVASDLPQYSEVAKTGDEFLLVDPLDPQAISQAALSILEDPHLKLEMGNSAGRTATEFYDWESIGRKTAALYEELHSQPFDR